MTLPADVFRCRAPLERVKCDSCRRNPKNNDDGDSVVVVSMPDRTIYPGGGMICRSFIDLNEGP